MYTRNLLIKILKVKNVLLYILGVIIIMASLYVNVSDMVYEIFSTENLLFTGILLLVGLVCVVLGILSNCWIGDANMYSAYFEGDLDGLISMTDMARLMGMPVPVAELKLRIFRHVYIKGFCFEKHGNNTHIILDSRKIVCQCKECGGEMEKSEHFTNKCGYCGGLDISTKVLCGDEFYSIENDIAKGYGNPEFYQMPKLRRKWVLAMIIWGIGAIFVLISIMGFADNFSHYLKDRSNKDLLDTAVVFATIGIGFSIPVINGIKRMECVRVALRSAEYFAKRKTPYVKLSSIPFIKSGINKSKRVRVLRRTVRKRYLSNCNFEIHKNELTLVLSKRIVKNRCPYCGGAISVPVNENYKCTSCDRKIINLVKAK